MRVIQKEILTIKECSMSVRQKEIFSIGVILEEKTLLTERGLYMYTGILFTQAIHNG